MTGIFSKSKEMNGTIEISPTTKILLSYAASYITAFALIILFYVFGMFGSGYFSAVSSGGTWLIW